MPTAYEFRRLPIDSLAANVAHEWDRHIASWQDCRELVSPAFRTYVDAEIFIREVCTRPPAHLKAFA